MKKSGRRSFLMSKTNKLTNKDFIHWHCHGEFSSFDGLSKVAELNLDIEDQHLAIKARKMGFPAVALTDHGVIAGWIKFIQACLATKDKKGRDIPYDPITPILGAEFYLARNHEWKNKELQPDGRKGNRHLNLFARNWKGYQNLCALSEKSWVDGFYHNPRIDINLLAEHSEGLMCSSACLSSLVNANLLYDRYDKAKKVCAMFMDLFGDNFFLETMYHGIPEEKAIIPDVLKLSKDMNIPVVATNDCLTSGHMINTSDGYKEIEHVNVGDFVLTNSGNMREVLFVNERYTNKDEEIYTIRGYLGGDRIECTGNHPIMVGRPKRIGNKRVIGNVVWKNTEDLNTDDYLVIPRVPSHEVFSSYDNSVSNIDVLDYYKCDRLVDKTFYKDGREYVRSMKSGSNGINIPRYINVDDDFLEILGLYLAEGSLSSDNSSQIHFGFHRKEKHLVDKICNFFQKFGLSVEKKEESNGTSVRVVSAVFHAIFLKLCGSRSEDKKMPTLNSKKSFYGSFSKQQILKILSFYTEGDGCEPDGRKPITIGSTSKRLIYEISSILNSLDILSLPICRDFKKNSSFKEWTHKNPNANIDNWNNLYVIHISGNNKFRYQKLIGRSVKHYEKGRQNYLYDENNYYVKISNISKSNDVKKVFNFQVEEEENYIANGVSVHNCHYVRKQDSATQEVLMCMSTSRCLNDPKRIHFPYGEFYLKDINDMQKIYGHVPQVLWNSRKMLEHIEFDDIKKNLYGGMRLPKFELPEGFESPMKYLIHLAKEGLKKHGWANSKKHIDRLKLELNDVRVAKDINNYDFATYFLIVRDYIKAANDRGIIVGCGRGSGYGSVLLRCLDITYGLDPLEYGLLWERFLGFDSKRFVIESDFGFDIDMASVAIESSLDENRDYEDDQGGVDRY